MKDRIAKSVFWLVWSRGLIQFISFFSTLVVARFLNPSDYGLMALAGLCLSVIALLADMGLGSVVIQYQNLDDRELNGCFWSAMSVGVVAYAVLFLTSPAIATWFGTDELSWVLQISGLGLLLSTARIVPDALLRKRLAFDKISQADMAATIVSMPVVLLMAWKGAGVWALVAGTLINLSIQTLAIFWFEPWRPGFKIGSERLPELFKYSFATFGTKACWALYYQADTFVLGKISGEVALGFYSMAKQLATLPVVKVTAVVNQLASPLMAELQSDQEAMRYSFLRGIRVVASATFPLSMGLMLVAEDLVQEALTEKWIPIVPVLQVLCLYTVIRSVDVLLPPLLMARYRANFLFWYTLALLGIMPLAFWAGAEWWGTMGVAVAWVVAYPIVMMWMAREALLEVRVSLKQLWTQIQAPILSTLVMIAAVLLVRLGTSLWGGEVGGGRLAIMFLTGATTYALTLFLVGGPLFEELKELLGWAFHRKGVFAPAKSGAD